MSVNVDVSSYYGVWIIYLTAKKSTEMHDLFKQVLTERDLSRAGDLFSISDSEIINDLPELVSLYLKL